MIDRTQSFRTKSIGVRVTEPHFARLQALADGHSKPLGEWCRDVLLERTENRKPSPTEQTLLAEVLALRAIFLNLFFRLANGDPITADDMHRLVERADADKLKKALARLEDAEKIIREGGKP